MEEALANDAATVAAYRQTVLTACRDVEDQLAVLRVLSDEAVQQADAVARQSSFSRSPPIATRQVLPRISR